MSGVVCRRSASTCGACSRATPVAMGTSRWGCLVFCCGSLSPWGVGRPGSQQATEGGGSVPVALCATPGRAPPHGAINLGSLAPWGVGRPGSQKATEGGGGTPVALCATVGCAPPHGSSVSVVNKTNSWIYVAVSSSRLIVFWSWLKLH